MYIFLIWDDSIWLLYTYGTMVSLEIDAQCLRVSHWTLLAWSLTGFRWGCKLTHGVFMGTRLVLCSKGKTFCQILVESRRREIGCYGYFIVLKFVRHLDSTAVEVPVKFQRYCKSLYANRAASRLRNMWSYGKTSGHFANREPNKYPRNNYPLLGVSFFKCNNTNCTVSGNYIIKVTYTDLYWFQNCVAGVLDCNWFQMIGTWVYWKI